ncbi:MULTISPECIES: metallophosphoesterase [unclassified Lactococcus]|uniref:metallophosphoesterase n=1 Tax=unclassified Lactococcus TaxID=2643510 RepID=UPI0011CA13D9|nr:MULTISPECIES: metallophosphoesterase [unclassified Lactococcus]MQW23003.1 metallophosphoesterase [Lactococcus sp. dk101]TXK44348.1 metallophosphoesterase [Lactococcus sp. dk310]TXK50158.1 metallophosphoesterase [Lactococcus sp. dk322]
MTWIIIILIALVLLLLYGIFVEPHLMRVRTIDYDRGQGLKIAQFTDTHFTWHTTARRLKKFAKNIEENQPDIILFTGDLFDKVSWAKERDLTAYIEVLSELTAPLGKFAIFGNHDFEDNNSHFVREILEKSGFTIVNNRSEVLSKSHNANYAQPTGKICISGIDDMREGVPDFAIYPQEADFSLLMVHEPDSLIQLEQLKAFDLIIAGHSHGGQIRIGNFRLHNKGSKYFDKGKYEINEKTSLYVNSGIGLTFLPIRIGVVPEIVYYEI